MTELRTSDTGYGRDYFESLDGGRGYNDSLMWADIGHIIHETFGIVGDRDRALETSILDLGCAKGFLLGHLRQRGYDVFGLDFSWYALEQAPERLKPYMGWADLTKNAPLPLRGKKFDVVTCFETMEHLPEDKVDVAIGHIREAMKPDGYALLTICVEGQPDTTSDPTHVTIKPPIWWTERFMRAGFEPLPGIARLVQQWWLFRHHKGVFVFGL